MRDRIFWRVICVGVGAGLVSIGYGLCKDGPLPSLSLSSAAYAEEKPAESPPKRPRAPIYPDVTIRLAPSHTIIYRGMDRSTIDDVEKVLRSKVLPPEVNPPIYPEVSLRLAPSHSCFYRGVNKSTIEEVERIVRGNATERMEISPPPDELAKPRATTAPKDEPTTNSPEAKSKDPAEQFKDFMEKAIKNAKASSPFDGEVVFDVTKAKSTNAFYTATATFVWKNGNRMIYTYIYLADKWWFKGSYLEVKTGKKTDVLPLSNDALQKFFNPQAVGKL